MIALVVFVAATDLAAQTDAAAVLMGDPSSLISPGTQPATQPAVVNVITTDQNLVLRAMRGENVTLTAQDFLKPSLWIGFIQDTLFWTIGFIPRLITACILLLIFYVLYRIVRKLVKSTIGAAGVDESICDMLNMLVKWAILGFGLIIAGNQVGIQIAALLTGVSIIGLAVGFAAQETLSNFIAGIMIFIDKPFVVGDWIQIDGHLGQVKRVTFRSTRMIDLDGDIVVMPNTTMLAYKVINKSANSVTRCRVMVSIGYTESIDRAREVLLTMIRADKRIEPRPEPEVVVVNLNQSSVDLMVHFWIKEERYEDAMQYEYMEKCKEALDAAGIEIPFPHMQLVMPPGVKPADG